MKAEVRQAVVTALGTIPELKGNVHPYKPDALAPPVAYVDGCRLVSDTGSLKRLPVEVEVVFVADGQSMAARQQLDTTSDQGWRALNRAGFRPDNDSDEIVQNGPNVAYPAVRLRAHGLTECP